MKTKQFIRTAAPAALSRIICGLFCLLSVAQAQNTSTATLPSSGTSTATTTALPNPNAPQLKISYLGIFFGPGLEFSGSKQSSFNKNTSMLLNNRPRFMVKTSENFDFGFEPRFNTVFGSDKSHASGFTAENDRWRMLARFKNVVKTDTLSLAIVPRIALPTSNSAHQKGMLPNPELVAQLDYAPKDTRFTFTVGNTYQYLLYDDQNMKSHDGAATAIAQPWLEADYQLTPNVSLTAQYWPEWDAHARNRTPLTNESHEIDAGAYFQVTKGWRLNPLVATDFNGYNGMSPLKNMQFNMLLIGSIL